jgi:drug/metabolite transporter (DMT)-like permease
MSGVVWACLAGVGFGLFQSANRLAIAGLDVLRSTFIQLVVSVLVLGGMCLVTEDLGDLWSMPVSAIANFSAAGLIHFFVGWTLLNASQQRLGATRTSPLLAATPLFGAAIAAVTLREIPGLGSVLGIALIIAGVNAVAAERSPRAPAAVAGSSAHDRLGSASSSATPVPGNGDPTPWTAYLFGLGTALCWAVSPIFTRRGLEDADSPLLGVTVGLAAAVVVYALALAVGRRVRPRGGRAPRAAVGWKLVAGVLCGLSTWSRWYALSLTQVAVVLGLGLLSVPTVAVLAPLAVGREAEPVTPRLLAGIALVLCGALVLIVRG